MSAYMYILEIGWLWAAMRVLGITPRSADRKCSIFWVISAVPDFYSKPFSHFRIKGRCKEYVIIKYYIILLNILFWDTHNNAFIINTSFFQKPLLTFSFQGVTSWPLSTYRQGTASLYEGKNMDIRPYFRRALPYCLIHC